MTTVSQSQQLFNRQSARPKRNARLSQQDGFFGDIKRNDGSALVGLIRTKKFNYLADKAYNTQKGYAIETINGQKIMYVSGSRNITDWGFNALDVFLPKKAQFFSSQTSKNLSAIAKANNVDVVVGHSRGAKLVADMDKGPYQKMGLDGAMLLATKDHGMLNIAEKQPLDRLIGLGGKNNYWVKPKKGPTNWHFASRNYTGYKNTYKGGWKKDKKHQRRVAGKFAKGLTRKAGAAGYKYTRRYTKKAVENYFR